jgi:hypothetical protein
MSNFTFDNKMMKLALLANGYSEAWAENNWVHESDSNKDVSGRELEEAFKQLLRSKNLI